MNASRLTRDPVGSRRDCTARVVSSPCQNFRSVGANVGALGFRKKLGYLGSLVGANVMVPRRSLTSSI